MNRNGGGCALLIGGVLLIGLLMWAVAFALVIGAIVVAIAGLVLGIGIIMNAVQQTKRAQEVEAMEDVIAQMTAEAKTDIAMTLFDLEQVISTRGVGTAFEEDFFTSMSVLRSEQKQLQVMMRRLSIEPDSASRLGAVTEAEALRLRVEEMLNRPA